MTQMNDQNDLQNSNDDMPFTLANDPSFEESAKENVKLDLEDAPFLQEDKKEKEPEDAKKNERKKDAKDEEEEEAPKSKKKLLLIIVGVLLLAVIGAGAYVFLFMGKTVEQVIAQNIVVVPTTVKKDVTDKLQVRLDPFWIELGENSRKAEFLNAKFILVLDNPQLNREITANQGIVRDAIYYYLINSDVEFLMDYKNIEEIKAGMIEIINQYVVQGAVKDIYFDSFLYE